MKNHDPRALLRSLIDGRTQAEVAVELGVTTQYLSDILHNRREPGPTVLKALGLRKVVLYQREPA
jgi:transcriptional regulator with XRE-family HTH domain